MNKTLPPFTLGWELEACKRASVVPQGIECTHDGSVDGDSMEYKICRNLVNDVGVSLHALRKLVTDETILVNQSCGFHVHMGLGRRTRQSGAWAAWFVQLARAIEHDAWDAVPASRRNNEYCRSWSGNRGSILNKRYPAEKYNNRPDRYYWVNVVEMFRPGGIRTVEVRLLGNTRRLTYLLSWIAVCRLMSMSAWVCLFDPSKMEEETAELKKAFALVRDTYLGPNREDRTKAARTAVYLLEKARMLAPHGQPLREITQEEINLAAQNNVAEAEALEFERIFGEMRRRQTQVASTLRPPSVDELRNMVICTVRPSDGHMTVGERYHVIDRNDEHVQVENDQGEAWWVDVNRVRTLSDSEVQQLCVAS